MYSEKLSYTSHANIFLKNTVKTTDFKKYTGGIWSDFQMNIECTVNISAQE